MLAPPYQQSPGASTAHHYIEPGMTAVCFTRGKRHFLICRDPGSFSDSAVRGPVQICGLQHRHLKGRWADVIGQMYKWADY